MQLPGALGQLFAALLVLSATSTATPFLKGFDSLAQMFKKVASSAGLLSQNAQFKMELLYTNDKHFQFEQINNMDGECSLSEAEQEMCFGGFARVSTIIKQAREQAQKGETPPVVVLNAGDNFQGFIYYNLFKTDTVTKFMNMLQFDAMTLGRHEFDNGPTGLKQHLQSVTSPIVAANVDVSECKVLEDVDLRPSVVLEVSGQKIAIIGYLTQETGLLVGPCKVAVTDEVAAVKKEAERLSQQGIKVIIALGNSGFDKDQQVALHVSEIDLVVGVHRNTSLFNENEESLPGVNNVSPNDVPTPDRNEVSTPDPDDVPTGTYLTIISQSSGKKVPVVDANVFTKYIGRLSLAFDADGEMTSIAGNPLLLDKNIPEDPVVLEELKVWKNKLDGLSNKIVGSASVLLDNTDCRYRECNLGNVIADALVHYGAKLQPDNSNGWTNASIALVNAGYIRNSIDTRTKDEGQVSLRDIIEVLPFSDKIYLVKLKGDVLLEVLEHSVSQYDPTLIDNKSAFLQVSGLQVKYNIDKPSGQRVEEVLVRCSECDVPRYNPFKEDEIYAVLIPSFMGNGGDGFTMIPNKGQITSFDEHSQTAVETYFNDKSPVYTEVGFRISIKNSAMTHQGYTILSLLLSPHQQFSSCCVIPFSNKICISS